jgi:hypothetical protein
MAYLTDEEGNPINEGNPLPVRSYVGAQSMTHSVVNVGIATTLVLAANPSRKYALIINDSDTVIYVKFGTTAILNSGIRLDANGGKYEMSALQGNLFTGEINAISSVDLKKLLVTEGE